MKISSPFALLVVILTLTACGGSDRPVYSGHQESTEGVPGFVNGQKLTPYVKLGQSYRVGGETYVPRHQPSYSEVGLASWYGPGFHQGRTANGETFNKYQMTAAHKTLPLPSVVKVTMLDTGKAVYVRINDRGPFAQGRIIDLSYAAAKEIGLMGKGIAKVRVEYDLAASQRYVDILTQGRPPESINLAQEVLPYAQGTQYATNTFPGQASKGSARNRADDPWWQHLNPVASAQAAEPLAAAPLSNATVDSAPVSDMQVNDLQPPAASATSVPAPPPANNILPRELPPSTTTTVAPTPQASSPFDRLQASPPQAAPVSAAAAAPLPEKTGVMLPANALMIQLGSFSVRANAEHLAEKIRDLGTPLINPKAVGDATLYRVQLGPYSDVTAGEEMLQRLRARGIADARFVKP